MTQLKARPGSWGEVWRGFSDNLAAGWSWSGFETSAFFVGDGTGRFVDLAPVLGADQVSDGRAVATGDLDGDGDLDMIGTVANGRPLVYVLRNQAPRAGDHLIVELVPSEQRSAAGAVVRVRSAGHTLRRDVALGSGFAAQHDLACHFGLGPRGKQGGPIEVDITWPDGSRQALTGVAPNRRIVVSQGAVVLGEPAYAERLSAAPAPATRLPSVEWDRDRSTLRILQKPLPDLSELGLVDLDGAPIELAVGPPGREPGGPVILLNLWATWCANCRREMPELVRTHARGAEVEDGHAGLRVVGLCMDSDDGDDVARVAAAWGLTFPVARADRQQERVLREAIGGLDRRMGDTTGRPIALPTSLVLTPGGKVAAVLEGGADVEAVLRFVRSQRGG